MLDANGNLASRRLIDHPLFFVGGSRLGTIALFQAICRHPQILPSPREEQFIVDVSYTLHRIACVTDAERDAYLRTLRVSFRYIHDAQYRLALESAFERHDNAKRLLKLAVKDGVNLLRKLYWCGRLSACRAFGVSLPGAKHQKLAGQI